MDINIRKMNNSEYGILEDFLYEAIFQRDELNLAPRSIIFDPAVYIYIKDFGEYADDYCLCAQVDGQIVGAVWVRIIEGFGSVDKETPEFAISLYREYRGCGIGTKLMYEMLEYLKAKKYKKTSLAVQKDNYAYRMYKAVGFDIVDENDEEYIMVCNLN